MRKKLSIFFMLGASASIIAQEEDALVKSKLKITDVYILPGGMMQNITSGTLADFQKLSPQSVLLRQSFAGYTSSSGLRTAGNAFISGAIGISSYNEKTKTISNPQIHLGFIYFSDNILSANYSSSERRRFDTLTSNQTGMYYYRDSIISKYYSMNYTTEQLRLDASVVYRTNYESRWSIFGGLGLEAGGSLNAATDVTYTETINIETSGGTVSNVFASTNSINEHFKNKNSWSATVYLPLGIDYRIGKKREFFKRLHLYAELRPGLNYTEINEIGLQSLTGGFKGGAGLRVNF
jgi:hypothetical protein